MRILARPILVALALALAGLLVAPIAANAATPARAVHASTTARSESNNKMSAPSATLQSRGTVTLEQQSGIYVPAASGRLVTETVTTTKLVTSFRVVARTVTRYVLRTRTDTRMVPMSARSLPKGETGYVRVVTYYVLRIPVRTVQYVRVRFVHPLVTRVRQVRVMLSKPFASFLACGFLPSSTPFSNLIRPYRVIFDWPVSWLTGSNRARLLAPSIVTGRTFNLVSLLDIRPRLRDACWLISAERV